MRHTLAGMMAATTLLLGSVALAEPVTVIPFDGYVELDGVPLDGRHGVRISFFTDAADTDPNQVEELSADDTRSCGAIDSCEVAFYRGEFSIALGTYSYLDWLVPNREYLQVEIEIQATDGTWTPLNGRRTIAATPYALWSANANDMVVGGDLTAATIEELGAATVAGRLDTGTLGATGSLTVDSLDLSGGMTVRSGASVSTTGALNVGGDLTFSDSYDLAGLTLVSVSGSSLAFAPDGEIASMAFSHLSRGHDITINGTVEMNGNLSLGELSDDVHYFAPGAPLIQVVQVHMGESLATNTGVSTSDWFCWIGGFRFINGSWDTSGNDDNVLDMYTYKSSGTWHIRSEINEDSSRNPVSEATMICAQDGLVYEEDTWFTE